MDNICCITYKWQLGTPFAFPHIYLHNMKIYICLILSQDIFFLPFYRCMNESQIIKQNIRIMNAITAAVLNEII